MRCSNHNLASNVQSSAREFRAHRRAHKCRHNTSPECIFVVNKFQLCARRKASAKRRALCGLRRYLCEPCQRGCRFSESETGKSPSHSPLYSTQLATVPHLSVNFERSHTPRIDACLRMKRLNVACSSLLHFKLSSFHHNSLYDGLVLKNHKYFP